jgi:hypothetical protein
MEANSHSGMDNKTADRVRAVLLRRIGEAEEAIAREPLVSDPLPVADAESPE